MKKLYILSLLLIATFSSKAQSYVLTNTINANIGDVEKKWTCDTTTSSGYYPTGGTGQIWNFTGVSVNYSMAPTSSTYVAMSSVPNASLYPVQANIAKTSDNISYEVSGNTSTSATNYGSSSSTLSIVYSDPQIIVNTLPFGYGQISTDTYSANFNSGGPITRTGTITTTGDATGYLNLPGKTYTNTLRVKLNLIQKDVATTYTQTINANVYVYFDASSKWSLLSVTVGTVTQKTGTVTNVFKLKTVEVGDATVAGIKEYQNTTNFNMFPNPASGSEVNLSFTLNSDENYKVSVVNAVGQEVKTISYGNLSAGTHNRSIDVSGLNAGMYFIRMKGENSESIKKLVIE